MMIPEATLGMVCVLVLVKLWRLVLDMQWRRDAGLQAACTQEHLAQVAAHLVQVNVRLAGLIEIEERKAHARAQLRTLAKGEGRALLRERLSAHLGG